MSRNCLQALELAHLITESCHALEFRGFMTIGSFEVSVGEGLNEEFEKLFSVRKKCILRIFTYN